MRRNKRAGLPRRRRLGFPVSLRRRLQKPLSTTKGRLMFAGGGVVVLALVVGLGIILFKDSPAVVQLTQTHAENKKEAQVLASAVDGAEAAELAAALSLQLKESGLIEFDSQALIDQKIWWVAKTSETLSRAVIVPGAAVQRLEVPVLNKNAPDEAHAKAAEDLLGFYREFMEVNGLQADFEYPEIDTKGAFVAQAVSEKTLCHLSLGATGTGALQSREVTPGTIVVGCFEKKAYDDAFKVQEPYLKMINAVNFSVAVESVEKRTAPYEYYTVITQDGKRTKKLVRAKPDGKSEEMFESFNGQPAPCVLFDAWNVSGSVLDDCRSLDQLDAKETDFLRRTARYAAPMDALAHRGNHDFKFLKLPSMYLTTFTYTSQRVHYTYAAGSDMLIDVYEQIPGALTQDRSQSFISAGYPKETSSGNAHLKYGYYADGKALYLIFDISTSTGDAYEGVVYPSWATQKDYNLADVDVMLSTLNAFLREAAGSEGLAAAVTTSKPFSSLSGLCQQINQLDLANGGQGKRCAY